MTILDQNTSVFSGIPDSFGQGNDKSEVGEEKINHEIKNVETQVTIIIGKRLTKYLKNLTFLSKIQQKTVRRMEKFQIRTCFNSWVDSIETQKEDETQKIQNEIQQRDIQIEELHKQNEMLNGDIYNKDIEKEDAQSKYRGAAKIFMRFTDRIQTDFTLRKSFEIWKADLEVNRIMENAFNKVLEINHKHVSARVTSAVNLLNNVFSKQTRSCFSELYLYQSIPNTSQKS